MSILKNKWVIIAVIGLSWGLLGTLTAGFYYYQYENLRTRISGVLRYVDIGVDYGNSTRIWHNHTEALSGATLFDVTKRVASINYSVSLWGTYVTAIDNVAAQGDYGWTYWIWDSNSDSWEMIMEGVDKYIIVGNEIFLWYYTTWGNTPP